MSKNTESNHSEGNSLNASAAVSVPVLGSADAPYQEANDSPESLDAPHEGTEWFPTKQARNLHCFGIGEK